MSETDYALQPNQIQYPPKEEENKESMSTLSLLFKLPSILRICCAVIIMILGIVVVYYNERLYNSTLNDLQSIDLDNELPTKFYLSNMPPNQNQGNRATCWFDFAFHFVITRHPASPIFIYLFFILFLLYLIFTFLLGLFLQWLCLNIHISSTESNTRY